MGVAIMSARCEACRTRPVCQEGEKRGLCYRCCRDPETRAKYPNPRYAGRPVCRHCSRYQQAARKRGLCSKCHADASVRAQYPLTAEPRWTICRHCGATPVNRPRGLCWTCYYAPGVRDRYPITSKFARRPEIADFYGRSPLPEPTDALPGTPEKEAVLAGRAAAGQELFHPQDARRTSA